MEKTHHKEKLAKLQAYLCIDDKKNLQFSFKKLRINIISDFKEKGHPNLRPAWCQQAFRILAEAGVEAPLAIGKESDLVQNFDEASN
ncbi:hypothetical protein Celaphus_00012113, partial [Cervus elaphus hippelaphus]